jgi:MFS family permease
VPELLLVRFITGLGLGGALPGIISITSEFTPRRMRATVVGLMFCGFPLGAVVGGIVAAKLIPVLGWQGLLLAYLLTNWIPIVARQTGVGAASAILAVAALNLGGVIGCLALGRLADRSRRPTVILGVAYALGGVAIAAIGQAGSSAAALLGACLWPGS